MIINLIFNAAFKRVKAFVNSQEHVNMLLCYYLTHVIACYVITLPMSLPVMLLPLTSN